MNGSLVFLDVETTGLDPRVHEVWEVAYAINDAPVETRYLPHSLRTADPYALQLNSYRKRTPLVTRSDFGVMADVALREVLTGVTIVGANPAFDAAFLSARWRCAPWHHRLIDVEAMALTVLGHDRPKGLSTLAADLRDHGYDIPKPDHTAAADVAATRAVYFALREEAGRCQHITASGVAAAR